MLQNVMMSSTPALSEQSKRLLGVYIWSILLFLGAALELADGLLTAGNLESQFFAISELVRGFCSL
jgi:hypothetical protein